ncbi:D-glucuronyl C5-epimerase family protein [Occultella gossypii]|uniref:D-glucuronyl C5-epimerase C-terminal domain-containing protein n=1 Tax=Occultella gossypii TaxID=2800820 RepID=A0ABS7SIM8_9MICO|nr:D-glucuronyl C5-epimerase family protein [Occultella gossypii]MBZ2199133.1 hypothetical protein [Occultella gossypii]
MVGQEDGEPWLHPVATSFALLARLQTTPGPSEVKIIEASVRSLIEAQCADGSWRYPVAVPRYGARPGWSSGMAQGLAISALTRSAGVLTSAALGVTIEASVRRAHDHMMLPTTAGGCSVFDAAGAPFFEECPVEPVPYILNGACFALIGLWDFERTFGGEAGAAAARRLSSLLPAWDLGYWSRYDLRSGAPSSPDYHSLHVSLLRVLDDLYTEDFAEYATRFQQYRTSRPHRWKALAVLAVERLLVPVEVRHET